MDGLDLVSIYRDEFSRALGTTNAAGMERSGFFRSSARRLAEYFEISGWPGDEDEVRQHVRRSVERYC